MNVVGYLRVSTDEQAESGAGLAAQRDAIERHCERLGWSLQEVHEDDGISGKAKLDKRLGLMDAINAIGKGDVLLVAKRDRLARDMMSSILLEQMVAKKGGRIVSVAGEGTDDDDPTSVLMRRMVDAFAEYERLVIAARTRAALQAKKRRGQRTGRVPFGKVLVEKTIIRSKSGRPAQLADNAEQLKVVVRVQRLKAEGKSMRAIADQLTDEKVPTATGRSRWSHSTVQRFLQRAAS